MYKYLKTYPGGIRTRDLMMKINFRPKLSSMKSIQGGRSGREARVQGREVGCREGQVPGLRFFYLHNRTDKTVSYDTTHKSRINPICVSCHAKSQDVV
jgi:hypothetical protein